MPRVSFGSWLPDIAPTRIETAQCGSLRCALAAQDRGVCDPRACAWRVQQSDAARARPVRPPDVGGIEGDGLPTMEEILALKLDADWVVLSACNTGTGARAGGGA
jgi:hypothetical protein